MSSAVKKLLLFIVFSFQTVIASKSKLLKNDVQKFVGEFLQPDSEQRMKRTSKQWSDVKIYENIFPNDQKVAVFRNLSKEEIMWETIKFKEQWEPMQKQKELVSHLHQNDSSKWIDVFVWFAENLGGMSPMSGLIKNKFQYDALIKKLLLEIAENIPVKFNRYIYGYSPLMIAAAFDDTDSIFTLLKRDADFNQQDDNGWTALHFAARYGSMNACAFLLENNADIDVRHNTWTPLMCAAFFEVRNVYKFLIEKGADKTLTNNMDRTALQLLNFKRGNY